HAAASLYKFVWDEYCDWSVEMAKNQLADPDEAVQRGTRRTLVRVLETALRLAHPIIPFVTEELWQKAAPLAGKKGETIMLQPYPKSQPEKIDEAVEKEIALAQAVVNAGRSLASESKVVHRSAPFFISGTPTVSTSAAVTTFMPKATFVPDLPKGNSPVMSVAHHGVMLDIKVDPAAERERLAKEIARIQALIAQTEGKLANESFVARAPAKVVEEFRARLAEQRSTVSKLKEQQEKLTARA
ncbi:MAG TPA: class I tRNA ligase family protein, partial [Burkholderiales bacterium]